MITKLSKLSVIILILFIGVETTFAQKERGIYDPSLRKAEMIKTWEQFNLQYSNQWIVEWNKLTGTPHRIKGYHIAVTEILKQETIENTTKGILTRYKELLQIDPKALVLAKAEFSGTPQNSRGSGTWRISYIQKYNGIPVYGGSVQMIIRDNKLTSFGSDFFPGINISTVPKISQNDALLIATKTISKSSARPLNNELVIFPLNNNGIINYTLVWKVTMPMITLPREMVEDRLLPDRSTDHKELLPVQWQYFIDAVSGEVIHRINLAKTDVLKGNVKGTVHQFNPTNPIIKNIQNMKVTLTINGLSQETVTDAQGNYQFTTSSSGNGILEAHMVGPHVRIHNEETLDPDATHTFSLPISGTTIHDWDWTNFDPSPDYIETNAFFNVNFIHDWFTRGYPFDITPNPYPMEVKLRDLEGWGGPTCNGAAGPDGITFPVPLSTCPDFSLCSDIVYHEFTHTIIFKLYGDAGIWEFEQFGAIHEGLSDYFGATITNNPFHGYPCSSGRHIDTPDKRYPENYSGESHNDGMILSGALWDTRMALGADYTDRLAILSLKDLPESFSDFLFAMLENDDDPSVSSSPLADNDLTNGSPNIDAICHAFYDLHGIYTSIASGHTDSPVALIISPYPTQLSFHKTLIEITGSANRSRNNIMSNYKIEYAISTLPTTWLTAGVTLDGGGTVPVAEARLATFDINGLTDGKYLIRLTVTDAGGIQSSATTEIVIDKLLVNGWPQNLVEAYYFPIAVADVDPLTPGLEVVAATSYTVYVYHTDGSIFTPWPKNAYDYIKSAPVVADLDNNGQQEIIISSWGYLQVWRSDGTLIFYTDYGGRGESNYIYPSPVIFDLDKDGDLEIIAAASNGKIFIVHHDGTAFSSGGFTWPKAAGAGIYSTPAVADIDNDLHQEMVFGCSNGYIYAWNLDGTNAAGNWPVYIGSSTLSSPAIGDMDNDPNHDFEIVIGAQDGRVYAWHHNASTVSGNWPVTIPANSYYGVMSSPALADIDHNGDLEVIVNGVFSNLKVLEHDGSNFAGWNPASNSFIVNSPVSADIDGNDYPEIFAGSSSGKFYALLKDGTNVPGFPHETVSSFQFGAPLITDLNQDGSPEIIAGSIGLYVWALPGSYNRLIQNWPTFHHDARNTGYYDSGSDLAKITLRAGSTNIPHGTGKYNFGDLVADGNGMVMSQDMTFTIENQGTIDLNLSNLSISSGDVRDFILTNNTSSPVSPSGGSTSFTIRFDPVSPGSKTAMVSVTTNDFNKNPFVFRVTGNGVPMDKIVFPPTVKLPFEGGPLIDGIVDKNPDPAGNPELGWNNAYRLTFGNGTNAQTAFQCLRYTYGNDPSIYMSFEVKNDLVFDNEDLIILNFRPDKNISDQPQNDFRMFIYPVYSNQGARDLAGTSPSVEVNPDIAKAGRPCRDVRYYQRQLQPDGITWKWIQIYDVVQTGFEIKVYSYKEGTGIGASYSWNVEMKMPRTIKRGNNVPWITLQDEFKFYFDVVRVNDVVSNAVQYIWPRNLSEQPYGDLEYNYSFPAAFWGDASLSSGTQCKGVWINTADIGVLNDPCQTTNYTTADLSTNMKIGQFNPSGELTSRAINRFIASVHNNTERIIDNGSSATLQPVEAKDIKVRFRIAHWGASLGTGDDWRVIGGLQPTDIVDPLFPPKPANCANTFTFKTTSDQNGWLPVQIVPPASGTTPPVPGLSHFFYDWILSGDENNGDVKYYKDIQDHQCVHVEVTSSSDADIITRSVFRNMNFVEASAYSDTARISTIGCGEPPYNRKTHNIFVQTRLKTWYNPKDPPKPSEKSIKSDLVGKMRYDVLPVSMNNPNVFIIKDTPVDSYAEFITDTYYESGNFIILDNKRYELYFPLGSFVYIAHHGRAVEEWQIKLKGIEKGIKGTYKLNIPSNSYLEIRPYLEAKEPYKFVLSLHGGITLPIRKTATNYSAGINGSIDFEYRKSSSLFFSSLLGYNQFPAKYSSAKDLRITALSAGIKYFRVFNAPLSGYVGLGPELLIIKNTGNKFGMYGEMGIDLRLNHTISLELGTRYNMEIQRNYEFLNIALGLLIKL